MSDYPDNMRQYDNNPRSPYFDDGGRDLFVDARMCELIEAGVSQEDAEAQAENEADKRGGV